MFFKTKLSKINEISKRRWGVKKRLNRFIIRVNTIESNRCEMFENIYVCSC